MDITKIVSIIAVLFALVAAFVAVPYATPILGVLGLIGGFSVAREDHVRIILTAIALTYLGGTFEEIPMAGIYVSAIFGNFAAAYAGAALIIILRNLYSRLTS